MSLVTRPSPLRPTSDVPTPGYDATFHVYDLPRLLLLLFLLRPFRICRRSFSLGLGSEQRLGSDLGVVSSSTDEVDRARVGGGGGWRGEVGERGAKEEREGDIWGGEIEE